jgi:hypothetical protein
MIVAYVMTFVVSAAILFNLGRAIYFTWKIKQEKILKQSI